jgi:hypothetical protein
VADEISLGALPQRFADFRDDQRERYAELGKRLDGSVPLPLFQAHTAEARREHDELAKDIAEVKAMIEADQRQRAQDRRMIFTALFTSILAPIALLFIQSYMNSRGGAP